MQSRKEQSIGAGKAEEIVIKAIRRVLEPDYMANIPPEPQEEAVTKAFEKIVIQSQSPPRQSMPGQQGPAIPTPAIASSAAATAAMTAAATAGATNGQPSASGTRPALLSQQPPPSTATMHQQPQPQRPAESVLMNMLMSGPGRSTSPAVLPPQASSTSPPGQPAATNSTASTAAPASSATTTAVQLPGISAETKAEVDLAKVNGVLKDLPQIQLARANGTSTPTRPFVEPLTPPVPGSPKIGGKRERAMSEQREDDDAEGTGKRVKVREAGKT
jgi:hypothetical protein